MRFKSAPRQPNLPTSWERLAADTRGRSTGSPAARARMAAWSATLCTPMMWEAVSKGMHSRPMRRSAMSRFSSTSA